MGTVRTVGDALSSAVHCAPTGVRRVPSRNVHRFQWPPFSPARENGMYSWYTCHDEHGIDSDFS